MAELSPEMWQQLQVFVRASFALSKLQLKQGEKNGRFCVDAWPPKKCRGNSSQRWSRDDILIHIRSTYSHTPDRCKDSLCLLFHNYWHFATNNVKIRLPTQVPYSPKGLLRCYFLCWGWTLGQWAGIRSL